MFERSSERARQIVVLARDESGRLGDDVIEPWHLLLGLAEEPGAVFDALREAGIGVEALREAARARFEHRGRPRDPHVRFSPETKLALREAPKIAERNGNDRVSQDHVALTVLTTSAPARALLEQVGAARVQAAVEAAVGARRGEHIGDVDGR